MNSSFSLIAIHARVSRYIYMLYPKKRFARKRIIALSFLFTTATVGAQDIHFSQFNQSPFNLNPALTGRFNGAYRLIGNQRTQWRSVTIPYSTFGLSGDIPSVTREHFSMGLSVFLDKAGDSRLSTTIIHGAMAKSFSINSDGSAKLAAGLMFGLTSMKIDYSDLRYDNQWNGVVYDPSIDPGENFARSSRSYFNLNTGALYTHTGSNNREWSAGISIFNLSQPKQSFFNDGYVRLDPRINLHGTYRFEATRDWQVAPSMLLMSQGKYKEVDVGGQVFYVLEKQPWMYRAIYAGAFVRTKDAGFLMVGMQYDSWDIGLSYDINTSRLRPASHARGGFEISVVFIAPTKPSVGVLRKICPDYI